MSRWETPEQEAERCRRQLEEEIETVGKIKIKTFNGTTWTEKTGLFFKGVEDLEGIEEAYVSRDVLKITRKDGDEETYKKTSSHTWLRVYFD